jgi:hypothetical protein
MQTFALFILLAGVIIAMVTRRHRRKLPVETMVLISMLDRLQTVPDDADPMDGRSA